MMSALLSGFPNRVVASCEKYPLPSLLFADVRIFSIKSIGNEIRPLPFSEAEPLHFIKTTTP